ncbi:MAG: hypothetical protein HC913_05370 [Microscillaceae bacterium]|nr:hypothetical protein [Microscillaceae bacterium]
MPILAPACAKLLEIKPCILMERLSVLGQTTKNKSAAKRGELLDMGRHTPHYFQSNARTHGV